MRLLHDVIDIILNGTDAEKQQFQRSYFEIATTPKKLIKLGLLGEKFTIRYGVITHHKTKDSDHDFTVREWKKICRKIKKPLAVSKYSNGFNLILNLKHNGKNVLVGIEVKKNGHDTYVNAVKTVFAKAFNKNGTFIYLKK